MKYLITATTTRYQYVEFVTEYSGDDIKSHVDKIADTLNLIDVCFCNAL